MDQLIEHEPRGSEAKRPGVAVKQSDQVVVVVGDCKGKVGVVVGKGPDKFCTVKFDNGSTISLNSEEDFMKLDDCAICMNPMTNPVAEFKCMEKEGTHVPHFYCKECVKKLKSQTANASCPLCRQPEKVDLEGRPEPFFLEVLYQCDQCDRTYPLRTRLSQHMNIDRNGIEYHCDQCDRTQHMNIVHFKVKYECDLCDQTFTSRLSWSQHVNAVHNSDSEDSNSDYEDRGYLERHVWAALRSLREFIVGSY